jgi:TetR/AcrR family transcriptional regulator
VYLLRMRDKQRDSTREKIVEAALSAMTETGFDAVSTRAIAQRAEVSQGLLTYHFATKDALWRAAADRLFALQDEAVGDAMQAVGPDAPPEQRREVLRRLVRFNAEHPEFFRFLMLQGPEDDERRAWLIETHLMPVYTWFSNMMSNLPPQDIPHAFYAFGGASSVIFSAQAKCSGLTGIDPKAEATIQRHADYLANLMVPE